MFIKGKSSWNKGIPMSEETKKKLILTKSSQTPWNKDKDQSPEHLRQRRNGYRKNYLKKLSLEKKEVRKKLFRKYNVVYRKKHREKITKNQRDMYKKNKEKIKESMKSWKAKHPFYEQKRKYGIDVQELLKKQNNKCAICDKEMKRIHVDHCHITNKTRDLLCQPCNMALGLVRDDIQILQNAIKYLKKHAS